MPAARNYANGSKKAASDISLSEPRLTEAKELRIKISQTAGARVAKVVEEDRAELWVQENREAFESSNAYVEKNGLLLEKYRKF